MREEAAGAGHKLPKPCSPTPFRFCTALCTCLRSQRQMQAGRGCLSPSLNPRASECEVGLKGWVLLTPSRG